MFDKFVLLFPKLGTDVKLNVFVSKQSTSIVLEASLVNSRITKSENSLRDDTETFTIPKRKVEFDT